jgi:Protein of unknown function (DUF3592)
MSQRPTDGPTGPSKPAFFSFAVVPLLPFVVMGSFSLLYGGVESMGMWRFLRGAAHTTGTVVAVEAHRNGVYPVVGYRPPGGTEVRFQSRLHGTPSNYSVGQQVGVVYDTADVGHAEIDTPAVLYDVLMTPLFGLILLGLVLLLLAVVFVFRRSAYRKAQVRLSAGGPA